MLNYDFTQSLSPIDFELLSKDLLEAELGIRFENFKEGKDKGIDLRYAPQSGKAGVVVQCKRYGVNQFANLKSSLKNIELPKIKKLHPERYILATSAGLTVSSFTGEESRILEIYCNNKMICYDSGKNMLTMIDKKASGPSIIKSEELRSIIKTEDAFFNFSMNITKEMMSQNRFVTGFAAYQTAAGIINQIMPFPVEN